MYSVSNSNVRNKYHNQTHIQTFGSVEANIEISQILGGQTLK